MGRPKEDPKAVKARGGRTNASQKKGVEIPASFPKMPLWLNKEAQVYWHYNIEQYMTTSILTHLDGEALATYCDLLSQRDRYAKERDSLEETVGTIYETPNGILTSHECIKRLEKINEQLLKYFRILGRDPLNRSNIKPAEKEKKKTSRPSMKKKT